MTPDMRRILDNLRHGRAPWDGVAEYATKRTFDRAVQALRRRGLVEYSKDYGWRLTLAGWNEGGEK